MNKFLLILSLFLFPFLSAEEEIRVQLETENLLLPAYLGKPIAEASAFPLAYLRELDAVLRFDLHHNAALSLTNCDVEKEKQLSESERANALHPTYWKKAGLAFVIKWQIKGRTLEATVLDTERGHLQTFSDLSLTGELARDRQLLHKLADSIHYALFTEEGIAHSRILFAHQVKGEKEWTSEIFACDWDGANKTQLTFENSYCVTPVALPSRLNHFLYVSYKMGQPKIFLSQPRGKEGIKLIDLRGNQLLPAISPKRDQIAFICDAGGRTDLFVQPFDTESGKAGKPIQLYSHPRSTQASPTFSPDGKRIAFVSDKDGGMRIFVIPTAPQAKRPPAQLISKKNRENSCPAWSPDGKKLAYSAKTESTRQIWIYDFETQEEWQLTSGPGHKENPSWAPNSKHLVFNSSDGALSELYIVNLHQKEAIKISQGPGKKHYPAWMAHNNH